MTWLQSCAFAFAVAGTMTAAPACAQVKWDLVSAYPAGNFHTENLMAFAKDMADVTGGKVAITVYPNASLFPATMIMRAVRIGQAQIGEILISLHEHDDPIFGIDTVPFLAADYDEARRLWAASKPAIERKFAAQGLVVLFAVPWPPQGIYSKKEINSISDMHGLSWRVNNDATRRIAQIVGAYPVTIQAADLPPALATGLIHVFMNAATGYDAKAWETMTYFYETQASLPKNVTFMNKAAFDRLDKPTQEALLRVAAAAEARGWWRSQDMNIKWYIEQLAANGVKVRSPSDALKTGLHQIGERLTGEWLLKAGADGQAIVDEYKLGFPR